MSFSSSLQSGVEENKSILEQPFSESQPHSPPPPPSPPKVNKTSGVGGGVGMVGTVEWLRKDEIGETKGDLMRGDVFLTSCPFTNSHLSFHPDPPRFAPLEGGKRRNWTT